MYWLSVTLLKGVKSFYLNSKTCIRMGNSASEWFPFGVGLRQVCVMSPWLFNIFMKGVVREVNALFGRRLGLVNPDNKESKINQLLFADDTALVADSEEKCC